MTSPPNLLRERALWRQGFFHVAGVDEAGRGAWAGPLVAAAVVLPAGRRTLSALKGVRDSKQLSARQREEAAQHIGAIALAAGIGIVPSSAIDHLGLSCAGQIAFWRAVQNLRLPPDCVLVDGFPLWSQKYPQQAVVRGDQECLSIAAASIIAKVTRDRAMAQLEERTPGYGFAQHKGYGSAAHRAALQRLGPSADHRYSFRPVAALCADADARARPA